MTHTTSRGRGRRTVRTAVAVGAATLGLVALSACGEKPTPMSTVTVGSDSVSTQAACYRDGKTISQDQAFSCAKREAGRAITVGEGEMLRIGVDPEIAKSGWVLFLNGEPAMVTPIEKTYRSFSSDEIFTSRDAQGNTSKTKSAQLSIVEYDGSQYRGVWNVKLERETSG